MIKKVAILGTIGGLLLSANIMAQDCFQSIEKIISDNYLIEHADTSFNYRPVFKKKDLKKYPDGKRLITETRTYTIDDNLTFKIKYGPNSGYCELSEIVKFPNDSIEELRGNHIDFNGDGNFNSHNVHMSYNTQKEDGTLEQNTESYNKHGTGKVSYTSTEMRDLERNSKRISEIDKYIDPEGDGRYNTRLHSVEIESPGITVHDDPFIEPVDIPYNIKVFDMIALPIKQDDNYKLLSQRIN